MGVGRLQPFKAKGQKDGKEGMGKGCGKYSNNNAGKDKGKNRVGKDSSKKGFAKAKGKDDGKKGVGKAGGGHDKGAVARRVKLPRVTTRAPASKAS